MSHFVARWLKISLVVIVGCGFLAMMIYAFINKDEISTSQIEPPLITPPSEPLKRRPDQPGGMQIPNRDKLVFDLLDSSNTTLGETGVPVPLAEVSPVTPASATLVKPMEAVSASSQPVTVAALVDSVQKTEEPVKVQPETLDASKAELKTVKPEVKVEPKVEAKVKEEPKIAEKPVVAGGKWGVQLAAVNSVADGNAMATEAAKDFPALKGLVAKVSPVPGAKKYRVQFIGLKDRDSAAAVCAKLAGKQSCFPVGG